MKKKIIGVLVCILFLFSTYPVIAIISLDTNNEESLQKVNDDTNAFPSFEFTLLYGIIVLERETPSSSIIKPIFIRARIFGSDIGSGFYSWSGTHINTDPFSVPKDYYNHGFVHKNFIFV